MTRIKVLKELFRRNLDEFNIKFNTKLLIDFEDKEFIIRYKKLEILKGGIADYGIDFEDQKKFIIDLGERLYPFFIDDYNVILYNRLNYEDKKDFKKIIGESRIVFKKYGIKIDKYELRDRGLVETKEDYKKFLEYIFKEIRNNLREDKINVVSEILLNDDVFLHVFVNVYEREFSIKYVEESYFPYFSHIANSVERLIYTDNIKFYYSNTEEKEAEKVIEYIKNLIKK